MSEQPRSAPTVDHPASDAALDAGLAAAFGPDSGPPIPTGASVLKALAADLPAVPRVQLREPPTEGPAPVNLPDSPARPEEPSDPEGRYQLLGEIARGGMGAVHRGRDADLGREVAVKVLLETHQGKTELVQRFVEEAQIAGQLQHPGITPVYELGQFRDRRPYFAMKLVKGKTLAALLAARKDPGEDQPRFVGIFGQVCQTLAYAHARGVIHRDLKPSNVMVGAFGEVQVMDWGLAKVLGEQPSRERPSPEEVSVIRTQRSQGAATPEVGVHTEAGTMLGTPAYVAPEQARGEVELVDERADVFGLGAILCEILTGRPPFTGKGAEAQRKAQTAQLDDAHARLDGCGAEGELIGLAKRCLAAEPWQRPQHAGEVAEAVTAYQQSVVERLRQAELARAHERVKAQEERKRRRLAVGLAAAVVGVVLVGGGSAFWLLRQAAERRLALRQGVEVALDKAAELQQQARWAEARAVLDQAEHRLGDAGPADLRRRVQQARADLELVDRLDAARLKAATLVEGQFDFTGAARDYAVAFRQAQLGQPGDEVAAVAARLRASAVKDQLVAALDDWAGLTTDRPGRAWLLAVARQADPDRWRARLRDPKVWQDRGALERLARQAQVERLSPSLLTSLGNALTGAGGMRCRC
jgi:serine/threonine-protein kinase